jgi:hypothetical protein
VALLGSMELDYRHAHVHVDRRLLDHGRLGDCVRCGGQAVRCESGTAWDLILQFPLSDSWWMVSGIDVV